MNLNQTAKNGKPSIWRLDWARRMSTGCPVKLFTLGFFHFSQANLIQSQQGGGVLKTRGNSLNYRHQIFQIDAEIPEF